MAYIGHPLLGDSLYGSKSVLISRQALHCYRLTFINPITNLRQVVKSPLPDDFLQLL